MRIHEVELVRRVREVLRSATDTADFEDRTPALRVVERTVLATLSIVGITPAPDGSIPIGSITGGEPPPTSADAEILRLAREIGKHWREQDGVNAALIERLAEVTHAESDPASIPANADDAVVTGTTGVHVPTGGGSRRRRSRRQSAG